PAHTTSRYGEGNGTQTWHCSRSSVAGGGRSPQFRVPGFEFRVRARFTQVPRRVPRSLATVRSSPSTVACDRDTQHTGAAERCSVAERLAPLSPALSPFGGEGAG